MNNLFTEVFETKDTSKQTPIEIALGIDSRGMTTAKKLYEFSDTFSSHYCTGYFAALNGVLNFPEDVLLNIQIQIENNIENSNILDLSEIEITETLALSAENIPSSIDTIIVNCDFSKGTHGRRSGRFYLPENCYIEGYVKMCTGINDGGYLWNQIYSNIPVQKNFYKLILDISQMTITTNMFYNCIKFM